MGLESTFNNRMVIFMIFMVFFFFFKDRVSFSSKGDLFKLGLCVRCLRRQEEGFGPLEVTGS